MEVRSENNIQVRCDKIPCQLIPRTRLQVWFFRVCSSILLWTCLIQLLAVCELWHPRLLTGLTNRIPWTSRPPLRLQHSLHSPPPLPPPRNYRSNGFLKVSCNGGLNQMRAANLIRHHSGRTLGIFIILERDEVRIIKRLPKKFSRKYGFQAFRMSPVSWSNEKYYLEQILPLFSKHKVVHFNRTDTRLANNGIQLDLQKLRCRVNFQGLKFTPEIETLGYKLVRILQDKGPFVALHLRYEMDMLAFSGCTHGCTVEEAEELKRLRYAYPWWREKEIMSEERRQQGLCPLTPEEATLVLQALGFDKDTQIYIASGEIFGSERRLASLRAAFPHIVKKETILDPAELPQFQNHSSQMAALDFMVSVASNTFIPTYYGNMAKVVEGHRRYLGFKRSILPDRKKLVELLDLHQNGTLPWNDFALAVRQVHEKRMGQPFRRRIIPDKPKEEDYFYANPEECLCEGTKCEDLVGPSNSSTLH
uniref:O-fucosyltransferase family protein n=1 Tax=Gossypium raimondii TaxID=29730 RepID=A0A0D2T2F3_GOSRA|nr:hypothetical protein B456_008G179400 [Gossypium raimondii]